jgi:LmbE family N-acetylglucosaminyl deacetylase
MRQKEVLKAAKNLGLKEDSIIFLGYPDGSLKTLFEENWDYNNLLAVDNGGSKYNHSLYNSSYEPHAPYCGTNLAKNIEQIIVDYKPTIIIYPDGGDYHPDHFGASAFVRYAEIQTNYTGKSYSYLVHYPNWPTPPYYSPHSNLTYPYSFATSDATWYFRNLNRGEESAKKKAIESYPTQLIVNNTYYLSFIRINELFTTYPDINIEKVGGWDSLEMPESSYAKTEVNVQKGSKDPAGIITESGVAYDDTNVYLLIKTSYNFNNLNFTYHIQTFNGSDSQKMDITVKNKNAILISQSNNTLKSMKVLKVKSIENMLIVAVPLNMFLGVDQIMLSLEYTHPQDYRDSIPWRLFRFPA